MSSDEIEFLNAMNLVKSLLKAKIIDIDDYLKLEEELAKVHHINKKSLYRVNSLIISELRVINSSEEMEK